jgi:hypothetical protein
MLFSLSKLFNFPLHVLQKNICIEVTAMEVKAHMDPFFTITSGWLIGMPHILSQNCARIIGYQKK